MEHFADKESEYFLKRIELLVRRCENRVEIKGDCIEKQQSCFISVTLKGLVRPETFGPYQVHPAANCSTLNQNAWIATQGKLEQRPSPRYLSSRESA
jgi:hypothetical protein